MTAVNRSKHLLSGSRNSRGISVDTIIYLAAFFFLQNVTTMHCFISSRGNSPNSVSIARPEPLKLSCGADNVDSIWSACGQQEIQGTE